MLINLVFIFYGKQNSIREKKDEQESKISAAIEIQRVWRGYEARLVSLFHEYLLICSWNISISGYFNILNWELLF